MYPIGEAAIVITVAALLALGLYYSITRRGHLREDAQTARTRLAKLRRPKALATKQPVGEEDALFIRFNTRFGLMLVYTIEYRPGDFARVMDVQGAFQSATYLEDGRIYELVFDYLKLYNHLFEAPFPIKSLLTIGGGGYAWPKYVIAHHPETSVDVIEADEAVTRIAERYFFLDRLIEEFDVIDTGRMGIITEDGRTYLDEYADAVIHKRPSQYAAIGDYTPACTYDAVVNDTFAGRNAVMNLASVEAAQHIKQLLTPGGMYLSNVISSLEGEQSTLLRQMVATLQQVFAFVCVIPCGKYAAQDRDNNLLIASDRAYHFEHAYDLQADPATPILHDANL
ncbi:spermidine synthase [Cryptobacterium curtum]|uniref:spermidine synthase n=1 Tax=Cryptobacterium curtum TaxID=84163 RepID=UPI00248EE3BD|nr:fused MFS/spermidine synthase [Cryptobacterium curtum]